MSEITQSRLTLKGLRAQRDAILVIVEQYGASNVRVFGSVARGEATSASDIDLLLDLPPHFSLLQMSSLVQDLRDLLDFPVQITSAAHLRDELRPYILRDAQPL
jgi:predicted nucleotidyltransferase